MVDPVKSSSTGVASDREFGQWGIDAAFNVKTTTMTRSKRNTD